MNFLYFFHLLLRENLPANKIIDTFLSSTVHGGKGGLRGPRYLPPQPPYFNGTATYYRLQEHCHE